MSHPSSSPNAPSGAGQPDHPGELDRSGSQPNRPASSGETGSEPSSNAWFVPSFVVSATAILLLVNAVADISGKFTALITPIGFAIALAVAAVYFVRAKLSSQTLRKVLSGTFGLLAAVLVLYGLGVELPKLRAKEAVDPCLVGLWRLRLDDLSRDVDPFNEGRRIRAHLDGNMFYRFALDGTGSVESNYVERGIRDGKTFEIVNFGTVTFTFKVEGNIISYRETGNTTKITYAEEGVPGTPLPTHSEWNSDSYQCSDDLLAFKNTLTSPDEGKVSEFLFDRVD